MPRWRPKRGRDLVLSTAGLAPRGGAQRQASTGSEPLVALVLVADPFGNYAVDDLAHAFDHLLPFKRQPWATPRKRSSSATSATA